MEQYIINKGLDYFTNMSVILNPIKEYLKDYNFLISDIECNYYPDERIKYDDEYIFITANQLLEIVNTHEIQFIWGVFSAIPKYISLEELLRHELPHSEGISTFEDVIQLQQPMAEIEIVSFDSSSVEIICKNIDVIKRLECIYPKQKYFKKWKIK